MTPTQNTTTAPAKIAGFATTTRHALHVTARIAGEDRHYILPAHEFNRFILGKNVTGYNRDLLNAGQMEEAQSAKFEWVTPRYATLTDAYHDAFGSDHLLMDAGQIADLFCMNRRLAMFTGAESLRASVRNEEDIGRAIRAEVFGGYV